MESFLFKLPNMLTGRKDKESWDANASTRQSIRTAFIEQEKTDLMAHLKDLEATVAINKQVIMDLCSGNPKLKESVGKLNEENSLLTQRVNVLSKKLKEAEAKLLIQAQMIEETKEKEHREDEEWKESLMELTEQLDKKEYLLQLSEKRCHELEGLICKYLKNLPEVRELVAEINLDKKGNIGISNIVSENKRLKQNLSETKAEVNRLRREIDSSELRKTIRTLKTKINTF